MGLLLVQRRGREGGTGARDVGGEQVLLGIDRVAVGRAGAGEHDERVDDTGDGHRAGAQRRPRARGVEAGQRAELLGEPRVDVDAALVGQRRGEARDPAQRGRGGVPEARPATAELGGRPGDLVVVTHHEHGPGGQARHGQGDDAAGRPVEVQDAVQRAPGLGEERGALLGGEQGVGAGVLAGDVAQEPGGVALAGLGRRGRRRPEHRAAAATHVALALGVVDDGLEAARPRALAADGAGEALAAGDVDDLADAQVGQQGAGGGVGGAHDAGAVADDDALVEPVDQPGADGDRRGGGRGRGGGVVRGGAHVGDTGGDAVTSVHRRRLPP